MTKVFDDTQELHITYPPSGFFRPGIPREVVRNASDIMNLKGKRALEEYLILRFPDMTGTPKYYADLLEVRRQSALYDGVLVERRAAALLAAQGYFVARCSPVQPTIDLVAFAVTPTPDASVRLIQVKAGHFVPARQKKKLYSLARGVASNVRVEVWSFGDLKPQPKITIIPRD